MKDNSNTKHDSRESRSPLTIDRREFLKVTGSGIVILFTVGEPENLFSQHGSGQTDPEDFNTYLRIGEDGKVSCFTGKIEMGQGIITSLAQMLADELDVAFESIHMVMGDTDLCPWDMGTFGSRSTRFFGPPLRAAGAEARRVLMDLAAEKLKLPLDELATDKGAVFEKTNRNNQITYASLAKGEKIIRHVKDPVQVKTPDQFKSMHKSLNRVDAKAKVTGDAKYAGDIHLPGMMYASILRPPAHGARTLDVDLSEAKKIKGARVIQDGDLIAVLHKYPDVAEKAMSRIKAKFEVPDSDLDEKTIFEHLLKIAPEGEIVSRNGDMQKGREQTVRIIDETYLDGYVAHAPIEPHTAVVKIEGKKVTVWASTQTPFRAKDEVAETLGLPSGNVRVITPFVGGGYGGKTRNLQVVEAARLAKLSGKPVQVAWSRKDEFFHDSFRPAAVVKISSGLTDRNRISFWDYHVYFAGDRGSEHFYDIPNYATIAHGSTWRNPPGTHPFATGAWRAPANNTNTFARESHIDIMAVTGKIDPFEFRMRHLKDTKMRDVLQTAANKFGWTSAKTGDNTGRGIACGIDAGTYVATIADVEVNKKTGQVRVKRIVCAQNMGLSINPQGARIQMEGCIIMGLGYALKEDLRFKGGEIKDLNFDTYEIPRFSWVPKIDPIIIEDVNAPPQGGGEPAIVTIGGAIANAIYDAVGARVTQMPMTPDRVIKAR